MTLAVSFLAFNNSSAPYLEDFLSSLEKTLRNLDFNVCILAGDNSSDDFRLNELQINEFFSDLPYHFEYIRFGKNLGFARAYNKLIRRAKDLKVEYFLMLNPDMIFDENLIATLFYELKAKPELASVCPKIFYWDFNKKMKTNILDSCGIILKTGLRFSDLGQGQEDLGYYDNSKILGPSGAAALFRMSALEKIKIAGQYFDERFFMYKEDCDLAYRLSNHGYTSMLVPQATAYHDRSLSLKKGLRARIIDWKSRSKWQRVWSFKGQHIIFIKHWSKENFFSKIIIILELVIYFIFSLLFANFLLKAYTNKLKINGID